MKEFIYFFKHKNISGVKIGKTSGDSVNQRFSCFKIYSPYGSEIIGFFECENAIQIESIIHKELSANLMSGEWFDISEDHAISIINRYDLSLHKIKSVFNEWISKPENDIQSLLNLMKRANEKNIEFKEDSIELTNIKMYFTDGDNFFTTTMVLNELVKIKPYQYSLNKLGSSLKKAGFKRIKKNGVYGYLLKIKE